MEKLHKAPLRTELPRVDFPPLYELSAPQGWRWAVLPEEDAPVVVWHLVLPVGNAVAPRAGLTRLSLRSLLRGTRRLGAEELHERLEATGARLDISVGQDFSVVHCLCLPVVAEHVFALLEEILAEPAFASEEVERERQRQEAAAREWCQDPEALARYAFFRALDPEHPYGQPLLGTPASLAQLTAQECRRWYEQVCRAAPRLCLVGGAVSERQAQQWMERLAQLFPSESCSMLPPALPRQWQRRIGLVEKPAAVQSCLTIGLPAPSPQEVDYTAASLLTTLVGGYFLSRLNRRLREHEGMTYGVSAVLSPFRAGSMVLIEGAFGMEWSERACAIVLEELERLRQEKVPQEEMQRVVRVLYGSLLRQTVTVEGLLGFYTALLVHELPVDFPQRFLAELRGLTAAELFPVQQRLFRPEQAVIGVSGEPDKLLPQLSPLGPVEVIERPC